VFFLDHDSGDVEAAAPWFARWIEGYCGVAPHSGECLEMGGGGTGQQYIRSTAMSDEPELYDEPTKVTAKHGEVILDGPDGVDVKLTPEAARETSNRLWDGAAKAKGQRRPKDKPDAS
jgi:hypothetical protein